MDLRTLYESSFFPDCFGPYACLAVDQILALLRARLQATTMCKLTILKYTQCNCDARDGNNGGGFIVTKDWHNRLPLDLDAIPFERCTQVLLHTLSPGQSNTMEFPRCRDVQVTTVCFEGEVCFRCLMDRRSKERAAEIRALLAEHRSFAARYVSTKESASAQAESTRGLWQSIRASPRGRQNFADTIRDVRTMQLSSVEDAPESWEHVLGKQIACRDSKKEKKVLEAALMCTNAGQEQEKKRRQSKLDDLLRRLAQVNKRAVSTILEELEQSPSEHSDMEKSSPLHQAPIRKLRIARLKASPSQTTPLFSLTVPTRTTKGESKGNSTSQTFTSASDSIQDASRNIHAAHNVYEKARTIGHSATVKMGRSIGLRSCSDKGYPTHRSNSLQAPSHLSAEVAEFKPFVKPPPTEPRMMRAPTAPRAMRERPYSCSLSRTTWQPRRRFATVSGCVTGRGWSQ